LDVAVAAPRVVEDGAEPIASVLDCREGSLRSVEVRVGDSPKMITDQEILTGVDVFFAAPAFVGLCAATRRTHGAHRHACKDERRCS